MCIYIYIYIYIYISVQAFAAFTHLVVYTKTSLAESTEGGSFQLSDTVAVPSSVAFDDFDVDAGDLGGTLAWSAPADTAQARPPETETRPTPYRIALLHNIIYSIKLYTTII